MRILKRRLVIGIAILMLLISSVMVHADEEFTLTLSLVSEQVSYKPGDDVTILFSVANMPEVNGTPNFFLLYDYECFAYKAIETIPNFAGTAFTRSVYTESGGDHIGRQTDRISTNWGSIDKYSGSGDLVKVTLTVLDSAPSGTTAITLADDVKKKNGDPYAWGFVTSIVGATVNRIQPVFNSVDVMIESSTVPVIDVAVNPESGILQVGETLALAPVFTPENASNQNVTWSSDNTAVATIDENGTVTAVAAGTANITVTTEDGGKTATCAVTVTEPVAAGYTVSVSEVGQEIKAGQPATVGLNLGVGSESAVSTYNAVDMTITYDSSKLTYNAGTSSFMADAEVDASEAGKIRITRYGSQLAIPADPFVTLGFTTSAGAEGTADVTVTSAKVDTAENSYLDAQNAAITNATHTITFTAPQTYAVTLEGEDVTGEATATEGLPYTFTVNKAEGYDYTVTVTKEDGTEITPSVDGSNYTVAAADITGPFTVSVTKTKIPESYEVTTEAGDTGLDIGAGTTATAGEDYTFTIAGFDPDKHELTVTDADGNPVEYVTNGDGSFTVKGENIKSALKISVTPKAAESTLTVEATEYLKLDGKSLWLLVANDTFTDDNNALAYSGTLMYHSDAYDGFCWLVESADGKEAVEEAAKTAIAQTSGSAAEILYDKDVNRTGLVDINDAQMTYNMYNAYYAGIGEATMQMFLEADVNNDKTVDAQDAAIIVAAVK